MISFPTAKLLRDAGYPQRHPTGDHHHSGGWYDEDGDFCSHEVSGDIVYVPLLHEIIAECGDDFEALVRQAGGWGAVSSREGYRKGSGAFVDQDPDEAVAKLYLAAHS